MRYFKALTVREKFPALMSFSVAILPHMERDLAAADRVCDWGGGGTNLGWWRNQSGTAHSAILDGWHDDELWPGLWLPFDLRHDEGRLGRFAVSIEKIANNRGTEKCWKICQEA